MKLNLSAYISCFAVSPPHTRGRGLKSILLTTTNLQVLVAPSHEGARIEITEPSEQPEDSAGRPLTRGGAD